SSGSSFFTILLTSLSGLATVPLQASHSILSQDKSWRMTPPGVGFQTHDLSLISVRVGPKPLAQHQRG
ncbi:hypothetical protein GIB67_018848, partial [Kingdonia uniflora]